MMNRKTLIAGGALAAALAISSGTFAQSGTPETPAAAEASSPNAGSGETPAADAVAPATGPASEMAPESAEPVPEAAGGGTAAPANSAEGENAMAAAQSLSPRIEDVQIVGPWSEGERSGLWRTIMMQAGEPDRYHFFVQQIETVDGAQAIKQTTEIKEIAGIDGTIVSYRADEPSSEDAGGLTLFFDIVPSDGEISETYELHYFQGSPYMFGPATN